MGGCVWTLWLMMILGVFVSFFSLVWFCLFLFMQGYWLVEFFGTWSLDVHSSILGENGSNEIGFRTALQGFLQYVEELLIGCEGREELSTIDSLPELEMTIMLVWT
jgi:hypothetical protein